MWAVTDVAHSVVFSSACLLRLKVTFAVLNLCNTHNPVNTACFNQVCLHINWKAHAARDLNVILKVKDDFSRSQAVTYTGKMIISRKRCKIEML